MTTDPVRSRPADGVAISPGRRAALHCTRAMPAQEGDGARTAVHTVADLRITGLFAESRLRGFRKFVRACCTATESHPGRKACSHPATRTRPGRSDQAKGEAKVDGQREGAGKAVPVTLLCFTETPTLASPRGAEAKPPPCC
jgi:hypothetical protein